MSGVVNAHIRHGDKNKEMKLVPATAYVQARADHAQKMPSRG
jgi:hypothetical protein